MTKVEKNPKDKLSKEQKRAQALRENLKKRKLQANLRKHPLMPNPVSLPKAEESPTTTN